MNNITQEAPITFIYSAMGRETMRNTMLPKCRGLHIGDN